MDFVFFLEDYYKFINFKSAILLEQIENKEENYTSPAIDILSEIIEEFKKLDTLSYSDTDDSSEIDNAKEYFYKLCMNIIHSIENRFNIDVDDDYILENKDRVLGITRALYSFFILDMKTILDDIVTGYIRSNMLSLYEAFKGVSQNKDAITVSNKKDYSEGMTLIMSNIYDIADYSLSQIDYKIANEYIKPNYPPYEIIRTLYNKDMIDGDYIRSFADIFKVNIALKSHICFNIMLKIKNKEIDDIFKDIED